MRQRGFSVIEGIIVVVVIAGIGLVGWRVWDTNSSDSKKDDKKSDTSQTQQATQLAQDSNEDAVPEGYQSYTDPADRFSFVYPETWEQKDLETNGGQVTFIRPSLKAIIQKAQAANPPYYEGPFTSLIVHHWADINEAIKDDNWTGKRTYTDVTDYLSDPNNQTKKVGQVTAGNATGEAAILPGLSGQYGVYFERPDGLYLLEFADVSQVSELSSEDQKVISSFTF